MITIGTVVIDAALRETHTRKSEVTSYPVEKGADVTDHVRRLPRELEIEGIVSDTPLGLALIARNVTLGDEEVADASAQPYSVEAWQALEAIHDASLPVTVTTSLRLYTNMVMESLVVPRDAKTGAALRFTATFREVVITENKRTTKRVSVPRAAGTSRRGHLPSQFVDPNPTYWCLQDKWVFVKPGDRAAAEATRSARTPAVWTDYRTQYDGTYTFYTRLCVQKEKITHVDSPVGFGLYRTNEKGKLVPLSDAESDAALDDLRQRTGFNDPLTKPPEDAAARLSDDDSYTWWEQAPAAPDDTSTGAVRGSF